MMLKSISRSREMVIGRPVPIFQARLAASPRGVKPAPADQPCGARREQTQSWALDVAGQSRRAILGESGQAKIAVATAHNGPGLRAQNLPGSRRKTSGDFALRM